MTLDLEEIERMAETCDAAGPVVNAATVLALVAEVRRCRALLNNRPALNAGLSEAYHGWTAAVYESEASARISGGDAMIDIGTLESLAKAAPQGTWQVWTSNSWRRVYANDKPAITPCVQRHDNHPDLMFAPGVKEWLEGVTPAAVLELVAEVRALREDLQATKLLAHANAEMFKAERRMRETTADNNP